MLRRSTWILLLVFALLAGFAFFFQRYQADKVINQPTSTPTAPPDMVFDLDGALVNEIDISDTSGNTIVLYRDEISSKWAVKDVPSDQADASKIETVSEQLFNLQVQDVITQTPPLDSIGLVSPAYRITITLSDGAQLSIAVGSPTPIGSGYYVLDDSGQVIIVQKSVLDDILQLLSVPPLLPTPTPDVTPAATVVPAETGNQATPTP